MKSTYIMEQNTMDWYLQLAKNGGIGRLCTGRLCVCVWTNKIFHASETGDDIDHSIFHLNVMSI